MKGEGVALSIYSLIIGNDVLLVVGLHAEFWEKCHISDRKGTSCVLPDDVFKRVK